MLHILGMIQNIKLSAVEALLETLLLNIPWGFFKGALMQMSNFA